MTIALTKPLKERIPDDNDSGGGGSDRLAP